jgi:outer membrane protein
LTTKNFEIKEFPLITKEEYIQQNIDIKTLKAKSKSDYEKAKITTASYLPKVTATFQASHNDYDSEIDKQDNIDNPWSAGLVLSMPLDINYKSNIESAKINYLKSKLDINDKKNELSQKYDEIIDNINILKEKIKIAKQIKESYKTLYKVVKDQFQVGLKTSYDVESLKNSLKIQNLEIEIQKYNILLQKIDLYFDIKEK